MGEWRNSKGEFQSIRLNPKTNGNDLTNVDPALYLCNTQPLVSFPNQNSYKRLMLIHSISSQINQFT